MLKVVPAGHDQHLCAFPGCTRQVVDRTGRPGRPSSFCDNPLHTYSRAYDERRKLDKAAAKAAAKAAESAPEPSSTPVTSGVQALGELIALLPELEGRFAAAVADARDLIADITDPQALAAEVEHLRSEARLQVAQAQAAQARAERQAVLLQAERDDAVLARKLAEGAADEATAERDEAIARAEQITADCEREITEAIGLRDAQLAELLTQLDTATERAARAEAERDAAVRETESAKGWARELQTMLDAELDKGRERVQELHARHAEALAAAHQQVMDMVREMREEHAAEKTTMRIEFKEQQLIMCQQLGLSTPPRPAPSTSGRPATVKDGTI
ncbi:hypothetical protein NDR87_26525 [Nocardia sp. CDC159]|uniref:Uncharacterized protein n=1 Tax=Nocardia pulmonis TaxID=2951408 RepID=A0A9X2E683_9NOCA|nr:MULTISPECIES: hypothetical protein [Nocardia]MCM6775004.1 hypothetical protein [Nocardia pulmonis]MCM6789935.1 hypothetical protein [Nocardia sp. CDC159]